MQSDLMDFHPHDTGLVPQVLSFVQEYQNHIPERKPCGRDEFIALLAGLVALRRTPGIPAPSEISFTALPQCASSEEEAVCRTHLERTFGIQDRESLPWLGDADLDAGFSCTNLLTSCRRRRPVREKRLCCPGAVPGVTVRPPSIPPVAPARPGLSRPPVRRPFHTIPWPHTHPAPRPFRFRSIIPGCTGR